MDIQFLKSLNYVFADLYDSQDDARRVVKNSGLDLRQIDLGGSAVNFWSNILEEAENQVLLHELINTVLLDFPNQPEILIAKKAIEDGFEENYSKLMRNYIEFGIMPVAFLDLGAYKAKSVCRVIIKDILEKESEKLAYGTGFLLKDDILITSNHILPNKEVTNRAVEFDFQESIVSSKLAPIQFDLDPEAFFYSSSENSFTVVKIKNKPSSRYPVIKLKPMSILEGENVMMIHHSMAGFKQISLWNSNVLLTEKKSFSFSQTGRKPGAAGAPIFNYKWQIVGMYYAIANVDRSSKDDKSSRLIEEQVVGLAIPINNIIEELNDVIKRA